jgi:hypothetical protein
MSSGDKRQNLNRAYLTMQKSIAAPSKIKSVYIDGGTLAWSKKD